MLAWAALSKARCAKSKPRKVRYYLERRDAEFEQKSGAGALRLSCRETPEGDGGSIETEAERGFGDHRLRREARHPSDRNDGDRLAAGVHQSFARDYEY